LFKKCDAALFHKVILHHVSLSQLGRPPLSQLTFRCTKSKKCQPINNILLRNKLPKLYEMWGDAITCQKYCFIHAPTRGDTTWRTKSNNVYFFGSKHTFWHNFSALPQWHVNFTWLTL